MLLLPYLKLRETLPQNYLNRRLHMENQYCKNLKSNNDEHSIQPCLPLQAQRGYREHFYDWGIPA